MAGFEMQKTEKSQKLVTNEQQNWLLLYYKALKRL